MTLEEAEEKIRIGKKYQHYKGKIYTVSFIAFDKETEKPVVVYYDKAGNYFTRPADMWLENINMPRFKLLKEE